MEKRNTQTFLRTVGLNWHWYPEIPKCHGSIPFEVAGINSDKNTIYFNYGSAFLPTGPYSTLVSKGLWSVWSINMGFHSSKWTQCKGSVCEAHDQGIHCFWGIIKSLNSKKPANTDWLIPNFPKIFNKWLGNILLYINVKSIGFTSFAIKHHRKDLHILTKTLSGYRPTLQWIALHFSSSDDPIVFV